MRNVEFRVWADNELLPVDGLEFTDGVITQIGTLYKDIWHADVALKLGVVELNQFTGIRDSSDKKKKIFEGDIVHFKSEMISGLGIVKWNEKTGAWEIDDIRPRTKKRGHRIYPFYPEAAYRVDGNIHESPELLEARHDD
ncbi:YopX family protein [Levilactobacillus brevis]|uniref:YopX family protein n=1 Tax=Levilactobacillus brevis TaxID=1580 RepID=UPI0035A3A2CE